MNKMLVFAILIMIVLSACSPKTTASPSPLPPSQMSTSTAVPPTAVPLTFTPTATPEPFGGGGTILLGVNKLFYPKDISLDKPFSWFSVLSDGSKLTAVDYDQIFGFASDGSRMLVKKANTLILINPDGTGQTKLETGLDVFLPSVSNPVLWLANGKIVFIAASKVSGEKSSIYVVNKDGSGLVKLNQPSSAIEGVAGMLFASPDESSIYWVTGSQCHERGICHEKYFMTRLDDSDQKQVWQNIQSASDRIYVSPSGKFIAYQSDFGWSNKNGCFLATIDGQPISTIALNGNSYCYSSIWSPVEDKLLLEGWTYDKGIWQPHYAIWSEPGNIVTKMPSYNAFYCYPSWMLDGKRIFFSGCTDKEPWNKNMKFLGSRIVNILDGTVLEYPDVNNCESAISPDSKWAIFYHCQTADSKIAPSHVMNLETKESRPIFDNFVSNDPKALQSYWGLMWMPAVGSVSTISQSSLVQPTPVTSSAQNLSAGSARFSSKDGRVMVYVPAGEFTMGSDNGQYNSKPAHKVNLDAFWIDQTEVSNGDYLKCIQESGCTPPKYLPLAGAQIFEKYSLPDVASLPVLNTSWDQAQAYCSWDGGKLPTEAQWEKAARGTDGRTYPWGEQDPNYYLYNNKNKPAQIGSFPDGASPYGALDMAGNVWEYMTDWYASDYYVNAPHDNPTGPATGLAHVIRGGSFIAAGPLQITTYYRDFEGGNGATSRVGFRCVATP